MDYIPPQAIQAEKNLIGNIILDKDELVNVMQILTPDDFYIQAHQEIYSTIIELVEKDHPVDLITISEKLNNFEYLAELTGNVSVVCNAVNHARIVKGKSLRRQYAKAAMKIIEMSVAGEYDNITDFKNDVLKQVDIDVQSKTHNATDIKTIALEAMEEIEKRYKKTDDDKLKYGFYWLDKHTGGLHNTDLTILSARPSVGKTAFALQIAINISEKRSNIAIFSLEMGKGQLMDRLISNLSGVEFNRIRTGRLADEDWIKTNKATNALAALNVNIYDDVFKVEEIRACSRQLKNKQAIDCIIIDYLQLCDTMKKCNNANEKVSYLTRQFKLLAKEMQCPVILLSQLSRANEAEKRRPKLIDLRDSGAIEQDADNVFFLHDPNYGNYEHEKLDLVTPIEFVIGKQRNGDRDIYTEIGFIKSLQRFVNIKKG